MGYLTEIMGYAEIAPAGNQLEDWLKDYVNRFCRMRHVERSQGVIKKNFPDWKEKCFRGELGIQGQFFIPDDEDEKKERALKLIDMESWNSNPNGTPGLWCPWKIDKDNHVKWNGAEKPYYYEAWFSYLIYHFFAPEGIILDGCFLAVGERNPDARYVIVSANSVHILYALDEDTDEKMKNLYGRNTTVMEIYEKVKMDKPEIESRFW